jgi:hypothetical protein
MSYREENARMSEIKDLIAFYEARHANWLLAAEFTLGLRSGEIDRREHWLKNYIMIPKRQAAKRNTERL